MGLMPVAVKEAARVFDAVRAPVPGLVVLIYHRVGARTPTRVDLPTATFRAQMEALAAHGGVLTLDAAVEQLKAGLDLDGHVVVTFDDGTADFVDDALPVLVEFDIPATLYVATGHVDSSEPFPNQGIPATWAALREAHSTGLIAVGSHTHSHALLDRLEPARVEVELDRSIDRIAVEIGVRPQHFAYPKALAPSPAAEAMVRSRFDSAALAGTRPNPPGTDPYRLHRSPLQTTDRHRDFERKVAGGLRFEDDLRRLVNHRRYRGATS